jgi:long-chain-fatty-acid--CoA ligase ACSBG
LKAVVAYGFEPAANETVAIKGCGNIPVLSWKALLDMGKSKGSDAELEKRCDAVQAGHCAALIYTSGTTGEPKAVMISHDNIIFESSCVLQMLKKSCGVCTTASQERFLSYLPLSHVAGMMVDIVCPVVGAAMSPSWVTAYFARAYDLKAGSLKDRLQAARPTLFLGVPLVWEKIADKMRAIGASVTGVKKSLATWAKGLGLSYAHSCQLGGEGAKPWGYAAADTVILSKIKANLGLHECKFGFTGAAPIRVDTLEYFGQLGLFINEVYGMSECCGACTFSTDEAHQWGSCGWEIPGVEVRAFLVDPVDINKKTEVPKAPSLQDIDEKYQGELCFRGRNIMMGYLAQPDLGPAHVAEIKKKTADCIDADGWLHSGDKGMITVKGMVKITGRYKELIIGEGGENIAPVPIEDHVKKCCDGIAEIMMIGDKRKYNVAFVTLKAVGANGEVPGSDDLDAGAARLNPAVTKISQAMDDKVWIDSITDAITSANNNGKVCPNNAFKIQKFTILPTNFSEEGNELTPTKKLKRAVVQSKYEKMVDTIYASKDTYVRYKE